MSARALPFSCKVGDSALSIAADSAGNSYISGRIQGCASFGATQLCSTNVTGAPCGSTWTRGLFVAKADICGKL
jgi:hypothetical protein